MQRSSIIVALAATVVLACLLLHYWGWGNPADAVEGGLPGLSENGGAGHDHTRTDAAAFITTWKTASPNESITIPVGGSTGAYTVDWGDSSMYVNVTGSQSHLYVDAGTYTVAITGDFERIYLDGHQNNAPKLQSIEQWGSIKWASMDSAFLEAHSMIYNAAGAPNLSGVTGMSGMPSRASSFNGGLPRWDASSAEYMDAMFSRASSFNGKISNWGFSGMTDTGSIFSGASDQLLDDLGLPDTLVAKSSTAPVLDAIEPQEINELEELRFNATAAGGNGTLTFSLLGTSPSGASIDPATGTFTWTPAEHQNGFHTITVTVSDGSGGEDFQDVRVRVNEVNTPPALDAIPAQEVGELSTLTLVLDASDTDLHPGVGTEVVASNLRIPWSIDWIPDGTALFTERGGNLTVIRDGVPASEPVLTLEVDDTAEGGLLGLAVDPDFGENHYIYLYQTYSGNSSVTLNKVVRYTFENDTVAEDRILIDGIPGARFHDGGRIQFGPDGNLYVTTGDARQPTLAQDLDSLAGKILRITRNGTIPGDNPFADSPVWSWGHRNSQGIDWDDSGNMVATEHGPSGERGRAHDEINLILSGANYGWPNIVGGESAPGMQVPILHTGDETWAPSGSEFYDGETIPGWAGKYFVATLLGKHLRVIDLDLPNNRVLSHEALFEGQFGRLRDVQTGPDGFLYLLTSNRDGRGSPVSSDDRIIRIVPVFDAASSRPANVLTYVLESAPAGASITPDGRFTWTPAESQDGNHTVRVAVSDGRGGADSEEFRITVGEVNGAPALDSIGPKSVNELAELRFPATASDADIAGGIPDVLTFSLAGNPPSGASITPDGRFAWRPAESQDGNHTVRVAVSDGRGGADSEEFRITVGEVNGAPALDSIGPKSVNELAELRFPATASDADIAGDPRRPDACRKPTLRRLDQPDGRFAWTNGRRPHGKGGRLRRIGGCTHYGRRSERGPRAGQHRAQERHELAELRFSTA